MYDFTKLEYKCYNRHLERNSQTNHMNGGYYGKDKNKICTKPNR